MPLPLCGVVHDAFAYPSDTQTQREMETDTHAQGSERKARSENIRVKGKALATIITFEC